MRSHKHAPREFGIAPDNRVRATEISKVKPATVTQAAHLRRFDRNIFKSEDFWCKAFEN
jgi:hypothetical protein